MLKCTLFTYFFASMALLQATVNNGSVMVESSVASPAIRHWGTCPPRLPTISFLVHFGVNLKTNYPSIV